MRRKELQAKVLTVLLSAAMIIGSCPQTALAVTGNTVAKDGTYTSTAEVKWNDKALDEGADDPEYGWPEYSVDVEVKVEDGKFSDITVTPGDEYINDDAPFVRNATTGRKGIGTLLEGQSATEANVEAWDTVSGATCTSAAVKEAVKAAINKAEAAPNDNTDDNEGNNTGTEATVSLADNSAAYRPDGTTFAVKVTNPQSDADYTDLDITSSMGRESSTLTKGTDYSVTWDGAGTATVTILKGGSFNKLGQNLTVAYGGNELGTVAIKSNAAVAIKNNKLSLTGGNGETVADYIAQITKITVDGTEYPTVEQRGGSYGI